MMMMETLSSYAQTNVSQSSMQRSKAMRVTLDDFTNREFDFLAEMIHEKLVDMGYETDGNFAFNLSVEFEESDDES